MVANFSNLTQNDFEQIFSEIVDDKWSKDRIKIFLLGLNNFGFTADAFIAATKVLRVRCLNIKAPDGAMDVCGTGGDKLNTLNISTAVAFIVASCGVPIAKHGNRAISSKSGSADVLAELGIDIMATPSQIESSLREHNLCFMFAPLYHHALKNLAEIRKEIGVATIFNFLGPLLNPANVKFQLIGTSRKETMLPMARALKNFDSKKIFLVHGADGMDEVTITDNSFLIKITDNKISEEQIINPEEFGIKKLALETIKGGDPKYNASRLIALLDGEISPYRDIVILNAALALMVCGKADSVLLAKDLAAEAIDSKRAKKLLTKLSNIFKN